MKTAREFAHMLEPMQCLASVDSPTGHTLRCTGRTTATEERDRELVEACAKLADDAMYPRLPGDVGRGWAAALIRVAEAIRSLLPAKDPT
jgi:hypothetical protein